MYYGNCYEQILINYSIKWGVQTSELSSELKSDVRGAVDELILIGQTDGTVLTKVSHPLQEFIWGDAHICNGCRLT